MSDEHEVTPAEVFDACDLRRVALGEGHECDGSDCVYWRVLEYVDEAGEERNGCAIKRFDLLADRNPEVAVWLLSVKRRVEELDGAGR